MSASGQQRQQQPTTSATMWTRRSVFMPVVTGAAAITVGASNANALRDVLDAEAAADFKAFEAKKTAPPPPEKSFKEKLGLEDKPKFKRGAKKTDAPVAEAPKEVDKCLRSTYKYKPECKDRLTKE
eukprot:CAMPEP_0205906670 /NCGR_PEP_ID=MMETSP1325-20131115/2072_1 /ASSEMBLY_ACC=CAM_ASM_000708 /TAXON_ID=236786 /ORGANISM="Florenciella sp., Strain RCC1007" /LENGTH=125 /DNA_ID=CAMNT_0053272693 /DNA_START=103 /DNA_END=480 /DNA_ORIENTATION=+